MWSHNSFGGHNPFPNGFNQEDFMFPATSFPNSSAAKQSFASRPHQEVLIDLCASNIQNTSGYMTNGFQPEIGLYNQQQFDLDSQSVSPIAQRNPPLGQTANPSPRPTAPQISSRAAELKAQLLARRGSAANSLSSTASGMQGLSSNVNNVTQEQSKNSSSSRPSRPSPHNPLNAEKREQELKLNDLISQYSDTKATTSPVTKQETLPRPPAKPSNISKQLPNQKKMTQVQHTPPVKSDLKEKGLVDKNRANETPINREAPKRNRKKKETESDASEGEIIEYKGSVKPAPPTAKQNGKKDGSSVSKSDQKLSNSSLVEKSTTRPLSLVAQETSSPCPSKKSTFQAKTDKETNESAVDAEKSQEKKKNLVDLCAEENNADAVTHYYPHQNNHTNDVGGSEDDSNSRKIEGSCQAQTQVGEQELQPASLPNLTDILPHNTDLREWLEITGYHNAPYRNKILGRRRAIAELDAQREKILAEIEAEERGGLPLAIVTPYKPPSIIPPSMPSSRLRFQVDSTTATANSSPVVGESRQTASNKRPHSAIHDQPTENSPAKIARIEEKNLSPSVKDEERSETRNSKINEHDSSKIRITEERERDSSRSRLIRSSNSGDRNASPNYHAQSRKASTRAKRHENGLYDDDDDVSETGLRPFEVRGNYRGRSFNPNYRGRGRGRGRGEARERSLEPRGDGSHGPKAGSSRSHKNSRGSGRGERGGGH